MTFQEIIALKYLKENLLEIKNAPKF